MSRDNVLAFSLFTVSTLGFFVWGYDYIPSHHFLLFTIATLFGLFMAFNIGGNDVANSFGTSVGAKTITLKQALIIAAIFELSGAIFAGGEVTKTIRKGIVQMPVNDFDPMLFVAVMLAALLSAGLWLLLASKRGLPVSTTHSIVGGIVGGSIALGYVVTGGESSFSMVNWGKIGQIVMSWVISPILGGIVSYIIYYNIKKKILTPTQKASNLLKRMKKSRKTYKEKFTNALRLKSDEEQIEALRHLAMYDDEDTTENIHDETDFQKRIKAMKKREKQIDVFGPLRRHIPIVGALAAVSVASMLLFKGLSNLKMHIGTIETIWIIFLIGTAAYLVSLAIVNLMSKSDAQKSTTRIFAWLQIFTASAFAFSHGANDIANAIGPFAAVLDVLKTGAINSQAPVPLIAMAAFGVSLIVGLWFLGKEVITTVGTRLAEILPVTGFSAELAASLVILLATAFGIPVSSTHILIGAVLGIGVLNKDANWKLMRPIAMAWAITLPAAGLSSALFFFILKSLMGL
jgi:PiT family inorganic phosphate transporter